MWNFRKILISFVLLFVFFVSNSYSEVVKKVKVEGNERISTETIIVFGDIVLGKNYELSDVNVLIKKLYETTFFSNVSVEIENNQLSIIVEENPIINSIIFKGEKAKKYTEKIKELSSLREKSSFIENNIQDDINLIMAFYRSLGFYFVKIDAEIEKLKKIR